MQQELSLEEICALIAKRIPFEAKDSEHCFYLKISSYEPVIGAAIHDGHHFPHHLHQNCVLSEQERWYEEDPCTARFLGDIPILFKGLDSRYYYDLNRSESEAVYETAWGKTIWSRPLTAKEREEALKRYRRCYQVIDCLVETLVNYFSEQPILVYDIHSYNFKRWDRAVPEINIGTSQIDMQKWSGTMNTYLETLARVFDSYWVAENDTFYGKGAFLKHLSTHYQNVLVFATEFKKFYCNELTGELYENTIQDTTNKMQMVIDQMRAN